MTANFHDERRSGGPAYGTADAARKAGRIGWNIRCNRCGGYGARWIPSERPGWHYGNLALCDRHADDLAAEYRRHQVALAVLREVRYEQERNSVVVVERATVQPPGDS